MTQFAPTANNAEERMMLSVLPDGEYVALHAPKRPKTGVLSPAELAELKTHTTAAATARLVTAAESSYERCHDQADAYALDIGDEQGASRSDGMICLVPASVDGEAKEHLDELVALFVRVTEDES